MNCLTVEKIYEYLENELQGPDRKAVEKHLSECSKCAGAVEERDLIIQAAESLPDLNLPPDFSLGVLNHLFPPKISLRGWLTALSGGVAAALLSFAAYFIINGYNSANTFINFYRALLDTFRNLSVMAAKFLKTTTLLFKVMVKIVGYGIKAVVGVANLLNTETQLVLIALTLVFSMLLMIKVRRLMSNGEKA